MGGLGLSTGTRRLRYRRRGVSLPFALNLDGIAFAFSSARSARWPAHLFVLLVGFLVVALTSGYRAERAAPASPAPPAAEPSPMAAARFFPVADDRPEPAAAPPAAPEPTPERARRPFFHTVRPGETVRALADRYGISVETLAYANKLANPDLINVGQELVILPVSGVLHRPGPGETLRQVAARYDVSAEEIAAFNELGGDFDAPLQVTQLVVPGATPPAIAAPAPRKRATPHEQVAAVAELAPLPPVASQAETTPSQVAESETAPAPPAAPASGVAVAPRPAPTPQPKTAMVYTVQPGDSINLIAAKFGIDATTILAANDIPDADLITTGVELKIWPVVGVEHEVRAGETLADLAALFKVDLGPIIDFNGVSDPDVILVGQKLFIPGGKPLPPPPPPAPPAPARTNAAPAGGPTGGGSAAPVRAPAPARPAPPPPVVGNGGAGIVANAMNYLGYRYVFGGSSPAGFDCSGFVWYVHKISGSPISRGMAGQYNGGPHIPIDQLVPGDTVFFANTYMPGLSHNGIYIGGGRFIHASDERTGVTISSIWEPYWRSRYVGATRLW